MTKAMTILGAVLLTASTVQIAAAGQREKVRKMDRTQAIESQQFRDSNAYYAPDARDWRGDSYGYGYNNRLQSQYEGGAIAAPAGR